MKRSGLALRFTLLTSLLVLMTAGALSLFALWDYQVSQTAAIRQRGITLARNLAYNSELGVLTKNRRLLGELVAGIFQESDIVEVSVTDLSGESLLDNRREGYSPSGQIPLRDSESVAVGAGIARITGLARQAGERAEVLSVSYPVFTRRGTRTNEEIGFLLEEEESSSNKLETIGEVKIGFSLEPTRLELAKLRSIFGMLTLAVIAFGLLATALLVRIVVRPIRSLVAATQRIAHGSLDEVVEERSGDEIGDLARSFNRMTFELRKSRKELETYSADLEKQVRLRTRELEEAQSQLVQAEKMSAVGLLVSGVAHELNNPLAGVVGYSQLLLKEDAGEKVRRGLEKINREAERCKKIVQNLQTFARKRTPQKEYIGVNGIVESSLELRSYQLRVDNIGVETDLDPGLPKTMGDFHQLQQVFINILVNAHQAMMERGGGKLKITSREVDGFVRFEIRDDGPGISEENLSRIFDPFFTTKEVGQGTGLGLSICYGIIEEHHGRISARNHPEGGALFTVELPILAAPEAAPEKTQPRVSAAAALSPGGGAVLVVDDELTIVDILYQVLKSDGYRVDTALSGAIALKKLEKERYDLIISDLKMPGMSGQELYERVRHLDERLARRIIFSTGDVVSSDTRAFLEKTGNAYLQKPFGIDAMRQAVMAAMQAAMLESAPAPR
ncbi:MAG: response regulator [Acidobacteria bacterium]|nr:response regulator [Acidobacteriota bacterium]